MSILLSSIKSHCNVYKLAIYMFDECPWDATEGLSDIADIPMPHLFSLCLIGQPGRLSHEFLDKMKLWSVSIWSLGFFFCLSFHHVLMHLIFSDVKLNTSIPSHSIASLTLSQTMPNAEIFGSSTQGSITFFHIDMSRQHWLWISESCSPGFDF